MEVSRHPKSLKYLFLTEMWERFGFYVVQGLLVLYMIQYFGYTDSEGYTILGVFTALVYITPLAGGYLANNYIGYKTAVMWGSGFLMLGYTLLALTFTKGLLYPALAAIIIGTGLFKPNVSSLVGMQYEDENASLRNAGFTIFYVGINIGSCLAGFSSGWVKNHYSWQMSFLLSAIGLLIGLITFMSGWKWIQDTPVVNPQKNKYSFLVYSILAMVAIIFLLKIEILANWLLPILGLILLIGLMWLIIKTKVERKNLIVLTVLILSSIVFWMFMFQLFYSANLFVDRLVEKELFGISLTTTFFYALEGLYIILLGPFFAWAWTHLDRRNKNPSPISKFILSLFFVGVAFLILAMSTHFPNEQMLIHPLWIFLAYLLITIAELLLSPIGLSAVTILAPAHLIGVMMGVWFVATGFGGLLAGVIAKLASLPLNVTTTAEKLSIYQHAFLDYAYIAFFVCVVLFFVQRLLRSV